MYDVLIVGGGPAGLSAALTLGRAARTALVCDTGAGRNRTVHTANGFLSRDNVDPAELRRVARAQLEPYPDVEVREAAVAEITRGDGDFAARLDGGAGVTARRVLLATGLVDLLPEIDGLAQVWGRSAFNCPYCDGFEARDREVAVIGGAEPALRLALYLSRLCRDLVLCPNDEPIADENLFQLIRSRGVRVQDGPIDHLGHDDGQLHSVRFADGTELPRTMAFLRPPTRQGSDLPAALGCSIFDDGAVEVNDFQQTTVAGVYAAGDLARRAAFPFPSAQIVHAASAGAIAAVVLDRELLGAEIQQAMASR